MIARHALSDIRLIAVASVLAVTLIYQLPALPSPAWVLLPLAFCLFRFPGRTLIAVVCMVAAATLVQARIEMANRLPVAADGKIVPVSGAVVGLPETGPYRTRFEMMSDATGRRLRLSWYGDAPTLAPGDCVQLKAKLSTPHGSANPGGFDYTGWLWRQGIDATGYVRDSQPCRAPPRWSIDRLRYQALQRLAPILAQRPMRGLVEALSLGVRQHITDAQWATLRATGTTHLVAISGLHIGLIAGLLFALVQWLALRTPAARQARRVAAIAAMAGALGYAALAGWALPTQRAVIMAAAFFAAIVVERDIGAGRSLAWAALAVVLWHPASVIAPGFWLSFAAVGWLIWIATLVDGAWWRKALYFQLGLVVVLMPLTLWFFGQASLVAPLINAVLIPAAGVVVPCVLAAVLAALIWPAGAGGWLLAKVAAGLALVWPGLEWAAQWSLASFHHVLPGAVALGCAMVGLLLLAVPVPIRIRALGVVLVLPAVLGWRPGETTIARPHFRVTMLDVGQGLASVVRTAHHTLVFDAGPAYRTGFDAGAMIVVPYLRRMGRLHVDRLMISHGDMDHIGGAPAIMAQAEVARRTGAKSGAPCRAGQHWRWDGVDFDVLYPTAGEAAQAGDSNEHSCVLRIHAPGASALLTGDIEAPGERALVANANGRLASDVLMVPHHGSATSSSAVLLGAAAPKVALVSAGWHNRWGFPRPSVVARYRARDIPLFNTATAGALLVDWPAPHQPRVARWRDRHRRFWQQPRPGG
ncbi:DNA internalization-related competence protein ComEC/Rec2 [Salinisphaera hydrothermalis]|uniref:DNA internalization-related competence protein ComEC/Rec2 n=1 Tax=Salinisphaera hydrothermalis (strain C41B8) TaxID=1304275 RepID=A0A084IJN2_SALHC|nr:DNA internalization-related competence protein ComEC/Rec2 [Salinisphaera hydrothermalis]KEZ76916.1 DNA internalization-related competence protein ComEC/Rec2 [Salinisphaera hydrothermalis C41B8]